jgi:hypothetical protein
LTLTFFDLDFIICNFPKRSSAAINHFATSLVPLAIVYTSGHMGASSRLPCLRRPWLLRPSLIMKAALSHKTAMALCPNPIMRGRFPIKEEAPALIGYADAECRPLPNLTLSLDRAAMDMDNSLDDGQTKPRTAGRSFSG